MRAIHMSVNGLTLEVIESDSDTNAVVNIDIYSYIKAFSFLYLTVPERFKQT